MRKIFAILSVALCLAGCKGTKALLPNVSGKAGEIIVVMEKGDWEGALGSEVRDLLACECPYLAQSEPLYTLVNVVPSGFVDLFKVHRNIVFVSVNSSAPEQAKVDYMKNVWAAPQCLVQVYARSSEAAIDAIKSESGKIVNFIEQAERDRVIANCKLYETKDIAFKVEEVFGGSPHFPSGYKLRKLTSDFAWVADEKQYTNQTIFVYKYPASGAEDELSLDRIVSHRNAILKENVPGMFKNTWMTTSTAFPLSLEYLKYRGRDFAQVRGMWEVENDFMGGPFVSHSFYNKDGDSIIVAEAFVYAPKFDKRQYLRQVESILYSWDWKTAGNEEK